MWRHIAIVAALFGSLSAADLNQQVGQIGIGTSALPDVVKALGEPMAYFLGNQHFTAEDLPETYIAGYRDLSVSIVKGKVQGIMIRGAGYRFRGKVRVGSSAEEVYAAFGKPSRTLPVKTPGRPEDGVLYDAGEGRAFYHLETLGARLLLLNGFLTGVTLIANQPAAEAVAERPPGPIPHYDPYQPNQAFQVDLRGKNLSQADLRASLSDLLYAVYDTQTRWPPADRIPAGFDGERILELGKDPGLGVRRVHAQGITGRGVAIAVIDFPLRRTHREFGDRIRTYHEVNVQDRRFHMHGTAAASIAAGQECGVAPGAIVHYVAISLRNPETGKSDYRYPAQAIDYLLQLNQTLPRDQRIRAISMQLGWMPSSPGAAEIEAAAARARAAGMLVSCSSTRRIHDGYMFHGLGREPLADPNDFAARTPGLFWMTEFLTGVQYPKALMVPMDSRSTASPDSDDGYTYYRVGGWSWAAPWMAGLYALTVQVDLAITPERFFSTALATGRTVTYRQGGRSLPLGVVADPAALLRALAK